MACAGFVLVDRARFGCHGWTQVLDREAQGLKGRFAIGILHLQHDVIDVIPVRIGRVFVVRADLEGHFAIGIHFKQRRIRAT